MAVFSPFRRLQEPAKRDRETVTVNSVCRLRRKSGRREGSWYSYEVENKPRGKGETEVRLRLWLSKDAFHAARQSGILVAAVLGFER